MRNLVSVLVLILTIAMVTTMATGCATPSVSKPPGVEITEIILRDDIPNQEICENGIFEYKFKGAAKGFCAIKPRLDLDKAGIGTSIYFNRVTQGGLAYFNSCSEGAGCNIRAIVRKNSLILFRVKP